MATDRIGIVGGGFSGTMALANLVRYATRPLLITWFDIGKTPATGVAYGATEDIHLLNVRADRIGAFSGKADGFLVWLQSAEGKAHAKKLLPGTAIKEDSFVPRMLFAAYLQSILKDATQTAHDKGIDIQIRNAEVIDARHDAASRQITLLTESSETQVDAFILATGNLPPRAFRFESGCGLRYVANVWQPEPGGLFPHNLQKLSATDNITIIGTGLTTVDSILTLRKHGFKGTITAISRHGWLPASHASTKPYPSWDWARDPNLAPSDALGLLKRLRQEIRNAEASGYDWRSVLDSLRPVTQTLWKRLAIPEKRKFASHLLTIWGVYRHRMPPALHTQLEVLQKSGALEIISGRIEDVKPNGEGLLVSYRRPGAEQSNTIHAALVLNCVGPNYDVAANSHRLLKNLLEKKLITAHPLRMGISTTENGDALGDAPGIIYPLSALLVGELLECTAVPEIRDQADNAARRCLNIRR